MNGVVSNIIFDMEMFRASDRFYKDVKIIAIGYIHVFGNINREIKKQKRYPEHKIIKEWKPGNDEKKVVEKFYKFLTDLSTMGPVRLIGYSILEYDIPLLVQKVVEFGLAKTIEDANEFFYRKLVRIDLRLLGLLLNEMKLRGSSLNHAINVLRYKDDILQKVQSNENGQAVLKLYKEKKYEEIEEHLINDLKNITYLYRALEKYIVPKLKENQIL